MSNVREVPLNDPQYATSLLRIVVGFTFCNIYGNRSSGNEKPCYPALGLILHSEVHGSNTDRMEVCLLLTHLKLVLVITLYRKCGFVRLEKSDLAMTSLFADRSPAFSQGLN